jgi:hypothetical protein
MLGVRKLAKVVFCVHLYRKADCFVVIVVNYHDGRASSLIFATSYEYRRLTGGRWGILEEVVSIAVVLVSTALRGQGRV